MTGEGCSLSLCFVTTFRLCWQLINRSKQLLLSPSQRQVYIFLSRFAKTVIIHEASELVSLKFFFFYLRRRWPRCCTFRIKSRGFFLSEKYSSSRSGVISVPTKKRTETYKDSYIMTIVTV